MRRRGCNPQPELRKRSGEAKTAKVHGIGDQVTGGQRHSSGALQRGVQPHLLLVLIISARVGGDASGLGKEPPDTLRKSHLRNHPEPERLPVPQAQSGSSHHLPGCGLRHQSGFCLKYWEKINPRRNCYPGPTSQGSKGRFQEMEV